MQTATLTASRYSTFTEFTASVPGRIVAGLAATAVVAAAAHVALPLPFTPVPFTLQPLAVLGVGLALGPVDGFFAMLAYLAEGAMGMPVFNPTGLGGVAQLFGATGGFLMAYPLVAAIAGGVVRLMNARVARFAAAAIACMLATVLLFASGAGWFAQYAHHSLQAAWAGAVAPFLAGEAVKIVIAAGVYSTLTRGRRIQ